MKVTHANESGSFWVQSADDHEPYKVDMTANEGLGACTCPDFRCRCQPKLDKVKKVVMYGSNNRNVCKHYNAVLLFLGKSVVARMNSVTMDSIYE